MNVNVEYMEFVMFVYRLYVYIHFHTEKLVNVNEK